jgi:hypothetical protein
MGLARRLGELPYEQRQQLFRELRQLILSLRHEHRYLWRLSPNQVDEYLTWLRHDAERARKRQPQLAAVEAVSTLAITPEQDKNMSRGVDGGPVSAPQLAVQVATPFITIGWDEVRDRNRNPDWAKMERELRSVRLLFDCPAEGQYVTVAHHVYEVPRCLWFVGDLHGDPLALENAWGFIRQQSDREKKRPHVVFLGDFVDRSPYSHETLLGLFRLILEDPGRISVLVGNHDESFRWDKGTGRFESGIKPAEYTSELNNRLTKPDEDSQFRVSVAKLASEFFRRRPRAVFLPDGLLLAHGGFPHTDLHESLKTPEDLNRPECLQDFVWLRANPDSRRKIPNRGSRGCDFGFEDFARFCERVEKFGAPVRRLLRGHDHVSERYAHYPRYLTHPVVTINTMCRKLGDEVMSEQCPRACVARHVWGQLPIIYRMPIDPKEVHQAFFAEVPSADGLPDQGPGAQTSTHAGGR